MSPILTWAFLGVGLFGQGVAFMLARRPMRLFHTGGRARGTYLETEGQMESGAKGAGRMTYFPAVEFRTARGENIIFASKVGGNRNPEAGTPVDVLYDPKQPGDAEIVSFQSLWLFPVAASLLSLPFLIAGVYGLLSRT